MQSSAQLPANVVAWLEACEYPRELIERYRPETRLVQDIGIVGHALEAQMQILRDKFHVDLSEIEFAKYFPPQVGIDALVISLLPRSNWAKRVLERYPPITLQMIDEAMRNNKWMAG